MTTQLAPMMIAPQTFEEWMKLAEVMAKSQIVPKEFRDKPGDVLVAMQMGVSVGLNPFQAVQSIAVINGRPCMWGDAVIGVVMNSPAYEDIEEELDETTMTATCTVKRKGKEKPVVRRFSMADAKAAMVYVSDGHGGGKMIPLADKPGPWKAYPKRMLQMRARAWALRDAFPDVLKGLAVREEVEDYSDEPKEPRVVGSSTFEERMAEMMPREKEPTLADGSGIAEVLRGPAPNGVEAAITAVEALRPAPFDNPDRQPDQLGVPPHSQDNYQPMSDAEVKGVLPAGQPETGPVQGPAPSTDREQPAKPNKLTFTVGKQVFETNGITRATLMELFKICPRVGKKYGAEKPAEVLKKEFGLEHRTDLTEEQAERYTIRLKEMLE